MLVDEEDGNVFPVLCIAVECLLDLGVLGLCVDDEKVLLGVWWCCDVLSRLLAIVSVRYLIYSLQHQLVRGL